MLNSSFRVKVIILVSIAFVLGCSEFIIVGVLNDVALQFDKPVTSVGYLVTIFAFVYAFSTPVLTAFIGNFRYFRSLILFFLIFSLSNILSAVAVGYSMLVFSRILTALVSGVLISLALTFGNLVAPVQKRVWLISWIFSGFSIASVFGVPLGTWISTSFGWRFSFLAITMVSIVTLALFILYMPRDLQPHSSKFSEQWIIIKDSRIWLASLLVMFSASGINVLFTYLRPLFTSALGFKTSSLGLLLFIFGITSIISNQLSGKIAEHQNLNKIYFIYFSQLALFILLLPFIHIKWAGVIVIMLLGITMYLLNSPIQVHFFKVAKSDYPQSLVLASALNSIFSNFGISLGSATGSILVEHHGLISIGVGGGIYALGALLFTWLLNLSIARKIHASSN
ncbi:arabinose efflux permease [Liquorilactobacillus sucicola DSM 21376 = JCM 15457]|uniref:Major facilitator superfamily protein n=1 Tax=Liquorilactobacillus sucicola DSM 21376 = JCM 15457 TaxID=1423806 RepID=A0A023CWQ1_9LACO|nr:MFS transporter [Liquorilactobacillus sucicola]KRN06089.1 major facilitator superfamily protein [Liquorilactobacillus sucicola DSM 21376 = JCM 15457]GAJ26016.1 arabinose efflux permease [Liquorilactobacillus sucicola DSM 21376 = JCM 15457]